MLVHKVLSGVIAGFGYESGTLRVVIKGKNGLTAYDYSDVTQEDAGIFAQNFGTALAYIKKKYKDKCTRVTDMTYSSE